MIEPRVVYESKNIIAVFKPSGYLVHALPHTRKSTAPILVEWLLKKYPEIRNIGDEPKIRPGIVHRLDRETSGVMLVARTSEAFSRLKAAFQSHEIKKTYIAFARGDIREERGIINDPISLKPGTTRRTIHGGKMTKEAVTNYVVLKRFLTDSGKYIFLALHPETGRTHQLRVHLASIGTPIVGDSMYGKRSEEKARLMLHALSLEFEESPGNRIKIVAEPGEDFAEELVRLGCFGDVYGWQKELGRVISGD
ncbi:MAG: RluA family pseudouridine synthase [Patescibacteria group bacterium]